MGFDATRAFPFSDEYARASYKTMSLDGLKMVLPEIQSPNLGEQIPLAARSPALAEAAKTATDIESFWKAVQASHMKHGRAAAKPQVAPAPVEVEARIDAFWEAVRDRHAAQRPAPVHAPRGGARKKVKPKRKGNGSGLHHEA